MYMHILENRQKQINITVITLYHTKNIPRMVSRNPTVMQSGAPMLHPPWAEANASTGIPRKDTSISVIIKFISNRLKSVHS